MDDRVAQFLGRFGPQENGFGVDGVGVVPPVGFDALGACGEITPDVVPTDELRDNQLGRLWHPCDAVIGAFPEIRNIIQNYVEKMLNKELTPEKALELAEIDSTKAIREYNELF